MWWGGVNGVRPHLGGRPHRAKPRPGRPATRPHLPRPPRLGRRRARLSWPAPPCPTSPGLRRQPSQPSPTPSEAARCAASPAPPCPALNQPRLTLPTLTPFLPATLSSPGGWAVSGRACGGRGGGVLAGVGHGREPGPPDRVVRVAWRADRRVWHRCAVGGGRVCGMKGGCELWAGPVRLSVGWRGAGARRGAGMRARACF